MKLRLLKIRKNKKLLICFLFFQSSIYAQVGINTDLPKATLDINYSDEFSYPQGLLLPRITVDKLDANEDKYGEDQHGTLVYVTDSPGTGIKTSNIFTPGIYFYNSETQLWQLTDTEAWMALDTGLPASRNTENIYQNATLGIGSNLINNTAQLDITSDNKGVLIPRLTLIQRNQIENPANGLLIYNVTTSCLNYFDGNVDRWLSMCGTYDPAQFTFLNCDPPVGPYGVYTEGTGLNNSNTYTLSINISEPGTYQILANAVNSTNTINGYSFSGSGTFTERGNQLVELTGQGTPLLGPGNDYLKIKFNGVDVIANCPLPTISVLGATTSFELDCGAAAIHGDYFVGIAASGNNYIDIPVSLVTTPGAALVETTTVNGLKFSSGAINIAATTTSIRLFAQGIPQILGDYSYAIVQGNRREYNCPFVVNVKSAKGTFVQPANSCLEIKNDTSSSLDGYYWVRDNSNNRYKTYCDMSNGGWTLVKSLSEKFILVDNRLQSESIGSQIGRNIVTTENGKFNEYVFSVPAAVVNNIGNTGTGAKEFRFTIKEKGHTTVANATMAEIESSTVAPINDEWTLNNYWNVIVYSGNPATGNFSGSYTNNITDGKIFGFSLKKPGTTGDDRYYYFDNIRFRANPPGMRSQYNFFTGFYGARSYVSSNTNDVVTFTYPSGTAGVGNTFTFRKYDINDLFGLYMNSEIQLNHHIGTCSNSTDDFGGSSFCNAGWSNWRPHRLNSINGSTTNFEGRIVQYWVK